MMFTPVWFLAEAHGCGDSCSSTVTSGQPFWGFNQASYKVLFAVHIIAIIAAFGPPMLYAVLQREGRRHSGEAGADFVKIQGYANKRISLPALVIAALAGIGLILDSSNFYSFSEPWVSAAFAVVIVVGLLGWFVLSPAIARATAALAKGAEGEAEARSARTSAAIATGLTQLGLVVLIILMIWKPGH